MEICNFQIEKFNMRISITNLARLEIGNVKVLKSSKKSMKKSKKPKKI